MQACALEKDGKRKEEKFSIIAIQPARERIVREKEGFWGEKKGRHRVCGFIRREEEKRLRASFSIV